MHHLCSFVLGIIYCPFDKLHHNWWRLWKFCLGHSLLPIVCRKQIFWFRFASKTKITYKELKRSVQVLSSSSPVSDLLLQRNNANIIHSGFPAFRCLRGQLVMLHQWSVSFWSDFVSAQLGQYCRTDSIIDISLSGFDKISFLLYAVLIWQVCVAAGYLRIAATHHH